MWHLKTIASSARTPPRNDGERKALLKPTSVLYSRHKHGFIIAKRMGWDVPKDHRGGDKENKGADCKTLRRKCPPPAAGCGRGHRGHRPRGCAGAHHLGRKPRALYRPGQGRRPQGGARGLQRTYGGEGAGGRRRRDRGG